MEETTTVLTIREIAEYLRCSKMHVGNLLAGRVPGTRPLAHLTLGRRKVVRKESFDAWLDAIEVRPPFSPDTGREDGSSPDANPLT